ncbi:MAG: CopG family transcriptional regulator/antitoxin EndoAI [Rhodothermales bacterium]|jgi:CopG family transcriptional regulator/antitoxin EndoAI
MSAVTVKISFQEELLRDIDAEAKREARSRSELLREAARLYVARQRRWDAVFALGDAVSMAEGLSEEDVAAEVEAARAARRR